MGLIRGYCFVASAGDYASLRAAPDEGIVPILAPEDPQRRARWRAILAWYGCPEVAPPAAAGSPPRAPQDDDLVVSLDEGHAAAAALFAHARGRRLWHGRDPESVQRLVEEARPSSLVLFAAPHQLTATVLARYKETIECPLGILTAADVCGLTFVVAKQLLSAPRRDALGLVDVLYDRVVVPEVEGPLAVLGPGAMAELATQRDWDTLILAAHGEGGHINLESAVLCGLPGAEEVDVRNGARVSEGCRVDDDARSCRRVHNGRRALLAVRELRARHVDLLTCSGFAVAGDGCPSNVSIMLALAEGYAASALSTLRIIRVDPATPELLRLLRQERVGTATIASLFDELHARQFNFRPFVHFGDPAGGEALPGVVPQDDGVVAHAPAEVVALASPALAAARALRVESEAKPAPTLFRTSCQVYLAGSAGRSVRIADASEALDRIGAVTDTLTRRLQLASAFERTIMLQFRAIHSDESSRASLLKLVQARTQVEQTAHLVRWARARVCETGVWSADLDQHAEQLAQAVARWDQQMALLLRDHLLGGEFELLLDQFSGLQRLGTEGSCDRCRAPLYHEIHQAPLDGLPPYHRLTCLVCGLREAWREDGVRLALALPERFVPGETLALHFSSSGPRCTAAGAQLVLLATDKGRGAPFARVALPCPDGQPLIVQLALPETLTPDLHTTVVAWVGGLDVAFFRFRTLGRATSAPAAG